MRQAKWKPKEGELRLVEKYMVTTDDSMAAAEDDTSKNDGIALERPQNAGGGTA